MKINIYYSFTNKNPNPYNGDNIMKKKEASQISIRENNQKTFLSPRLWVSFCSPNHSGDFEVKVTYGFVDKNKIKKYKKRN